MRLDHPLSKELYCFLTLDNTHTLEHCLIVGGGGVGFGSVVWEHQYSSPGFIFLMGVGLVHGMLLGFQITGNGAWNYTFALILLLLGGGWALCGGCLRTV